MIKKIWPRITAMPIHTGLLSSHYLCVSEVWSVTYRGILNLPSQLSHNDKRFPGKTSLMRIGFMKLAICWVCCILSQSAFIYISTFLPQPKNVLCIKCVNGNATIFFTELLQCGFGIKSLVSFSKLLQEIHFYLMAEMWAPDHCQNKSLIRSLWETLLTAKQPNKLQ